MKKYCRLLFIAFLFCNTYLYGQYELEPSMLIPTGDYYPYLLKPGIGAELKYYVVGDIDDQFRLGGVVSYYSFQPTQDTFITYAVGGSPVQLLPGYEVIHSYSILGIGATCNYALLAKPFSPVIGLDFYFHIIDISHDEYTETLIAASTSNDTYFNFVLEPRIGVQYRLNSHWMFSGGLGYSIGFGGTIGAQDFLKPYLSVTFYR